MGKVTIELEEDLVSLLHPLKLPVPRAARELMVFELFRRGVISSGKAAELLGISRLEFIRHASDLGIPYLDMTGEEWAGERTASEML